MAYLFSRGATAIVVAVAVASVLAGCVAEPTFTQTVATVSPSPSPSVTPHATFGASISKLPTAEETCDELIDINSLLSNERFAFEQGRVAEQEYNSFNRLVSRLVSRVDTSNRSALSEAVKGLQKIVGPYRMGAMTTFDPTAKEWTDAFAIAKEQCEKNGVVFYVEGWVGG